MKMKLTLLTAFLSLALTGYSQVAKHVLFIGNSYTSVNNLPLMVKNQAESVGDELIFDVNAPGGYRLLQHATNALTLEKIHAAEWDYVVLQEQSQLPAFPEFQKLTELYPYAQALVDTIRAAHSCTEPMFYMTWGRENGDPVNCPNAPWFCTYESMDDSIRATYMHMAEMYQTELAPAGAVWRYLRENHPEIQLYSGDGSHPSVAGTYAAGCAFYATIFKKDPELISWDSTLPASVAAAIRAAAKMVAYDEAATWDFSVNPAQADFSHEVSDNTVVFTYSGAAADSVWWNFGDGYTSAEFNPVHTYLSTDTFEVALVSYACGQSDTLSQNVVIAAVSGTGEIIAQPGIEIFPNPAGNQIRVALQTGMAYVDYSITNINGKRVESGGNALLPASFDVSGLSPGVYILSIRTEEIRIHTRFVKL